MATGKNRSYRVHSIAFILSLLLHALFLIFLLYIKFQTNTVDLPHEKPVIIFEEPPAPKPEPIPKPKPEQWATTYTPTGSAFSSSQQSFLDTKNEQDSVVDEPNDDKEPLEEKKQELEEKERFQDLENALKDLALETKEEKGIFQKKKKRIKKRRKKEKEHRESEKPETTVKPLPSLAQLFKGFQEYVKDTQNGTAGRINVIGKNNAKPTDEQLKHERYLEKIAEVIRVGFATNAERLPDRSRLKNDPHIFIILKKDGSIQHISLTKTSGSVLMDTFVLSVFQEAGSSFPPIPDYLSAPLSLTYIIII